MIKTIEIENFKSILKQKVDLKGLNILIGPNNSGKSNFLDAILFLQNIVRGPIADAFGPIPFSFSYTFCRGGNFKKESIRFMAELDFKKKGESLEYDIGIKSTFDNNLRRWSPIIEKEKLRADSNIYFNVENKQESYLYGKRESSEKEEIQYLLNVFKSVKKYQFVPKLIKKEYELENYFYGPYLNHDGSNLSNVLFNLRENNIQSFAQIMKSLNDFFPDIDGMSFVSGGENKISLQATKKEGRHFWQFLGPQLSDGFVIILSILTLINLPSPPKIILIEEIENGLNPASISKILEKLFEMSEEKDIQFIISSHSPIILELLKENPEHIIVCEIENGLSNFTNLEDKLKMFHDDYEKGDSLIEMWFSGLIGGL